MKFKDLPVLTPFKEKGYGNIYKKINILGVEQAYEPGNGHKICSPDAEVIIISEKEFRIEETNQSKRRSYERV
jgi:hypothetical protein